MLSISRPCLGKWIPKLLRLHRWINELPTYSSWLHFPEKERTVPRPSGPSRKEKGRYLAAEPEICFSLHWRPYLLSNLYWLIRLSLCYASNCHAQNAKLFEYLAVQLRATIEEHIERYSCFWHCSSAPLRVSIGEVFEFLTRFFIGWSWEVVRRLPRFPYFDVLLGAAKHRYHLQKALQYRFRHIPYSWKCVSMYDINTIKITKAVENERQTTTHKYSPTSARIWIAQNSQTVLFSRYCLPRAFPSSFSPYLPSSRLKFLLSAST